MEGVLFSSWNLEIARKPPLIRKLPNQIIDKVETEISTECWKTFKFYLDNLVATFASILEHLTEWEQGKPVEFLKRHVQPFVCIWTSQGNVIHEQVYLSMLIKTRLTLKGNFFTALKNIAFILMFLVPKMHKLEVNLLHSIKHFRCHFVNNCYTWLESFLRWSQFQFAIATK